MNRLFHHRRVVTALGATLLAVAGCAWPPAGSAPPAAEPAAPVSAPGQPAPPAATPAAAATPPPVQPYEQAVLSAATALLEPANARLDQPREVVIDPLIDGVTGMQSAATRDMGSRLAALIRTRYPRLQLQPFGSAEVARNPLVLIGTFTGVNAQRQSAGTREAYRICLALADLRTGKLVAKGLAFARPDGVDPTPLASFRDAPAWVEDPATQGYVRTCQGTKAGDPINPVYADRIVGAALVADAMQAYDAGRYREALDLFTTARAAPGGDQFRVFNGLYLASWKLGRRERAEQAFGELVDLGLGQQRLAIKFLFRPGSTAFVDDARLTAPYAMWLRTLARRTGQRQGCLEIVGHTSATGPQALNDRLSQLRAETVRSRLLDEAPALERRLITRGEGSRQMLVGNGRDDASDALDRRVEFKVLGC
ncbi:MAG: OmpA family protein [Rubrivivax sp.]